MSEISLIHPTPEGSREIPIVGGKISFGRGSEADLRIADDGLSRLNSTVYREGELVWIVDENSTNGSFVNGAKVSGSGTPLKNGDTIKIGHQTTLKVKISAQKNAATPKSNVRKSSTNSPTFTKSPPLVPLIMIASAVLIASISIAVVGYTVLRNNKTTVVQNDNDNNFNDAPEKDDGDSPTPKPSATAKTEKSNAVNAAVDNSALTDLTDSPTANNSGTTSNIPSGKKYADMNDAERRQYLEAKAMRVAQIIGNSSSEKIPPAAIDKIKGFVDAYASRLRVKPLSGCRFGDNLQATYERASKDAPFINRAFNEKGIDPRIGLYLAMIESEHCVCLQSPTGPLGMFQFTFATAKLHFVPSEGVRKGASPASPDDRCFPEPAARAAASYMKALTGRYGTGPSSVPLAIGSYNSGEGGLSTNLQKALESGTGLPRDFWTLISNSEILSKQFQAENFKYVPKFFAAAIIGENPQDFGLNLQPVSTYTK